MNKRLLRVGIMAAILVGSVVLGAARADEQSPFKGVTKGAISMTGFSFPYATFSTEGTGQATQLGRFTISGTVTIDVTTGLAVGILTFAAANGDLLYLTLAGEPPGPDPTIGVGDFTIVGGTGRFVGATG